MTVIFEVDLTGKYTFVSETNARLLASTPEKLLGKDSSEYMVKEDIPLIRGAFNRSIKRINRKEILLTGRFTGTAQLGLLNYPASLGKTKKAILLVSAALPATLPNANK